MIGTERVPRPFPIMAENVPIGVAMTVRPGGAAASTKDFGFSMFMTTNKPITSETADKIVALTLAAKLDFVHYEGKQNAYSSRLNKRI